ncbi:MAG: tetratricopeptide repeat protein [Longimicrobiales bacterium]
MDENGRARRAEALFGAAMELDAERRSAFLDEACRDDAELRREVDALLQHLDVAQTDRLFGSFGGFAASSLLGRQVGSYRILRQIGEGGMGTVYLVEREDVGKRGALKLVRDGRLASPAQLQRFLLERRVLARLEHPNIARLLDAGLTEDRLPYLVMEYVEGRPITESCDKHRLTVDERLHLFQQVCLAVQHAHQNLVVHRDLKPSNILVMQSAAPNESGDVKLLDFGIAKLLGENGTQEPGLTRRGAPILTPEYASPEQVRSEPITTASDVYSLGMVLYELLSGHRPYHVQGRTAAEVERVVCDTEPERPSQAVLRTEDVVHTDGTTERITPEAVSRARGTPPDRLRRRLAGDLDTIVLKALRKEPNKRYASVQHLRDDVRRYLERRPVSARPATQWYRTARFVRRHARGVAAAAAMLVLAASIIGVYTVRLAGERDRARLAAERAQQVSGFLVGLFEASDPYGRQDAAEPAARELLDRGAERIERELAAQPEVQEELMTAVGRAYLMLGRYDRARELVDGALERRLARTDTPDGDLADSFEASAWLDNSVGELEAAEGKALRALELRLRTGGGDDLAVAGAQQILGWIYVNSFKLQQARESLSQSLEIRLRLAPPGDVRIGHTYLNLAHLERWSGNLDAAVDHFERALETYEGALSPDHVLVAAVLSGLGEVQRIRGEHGQAEASLLRSLELYELRLGPNHGNLAIPLTSLARLFQEMERYAEAVPLFERAIAVQEGAPGSERAQIAQVIRHLGELYRTLNRPERAIALHQREIEIYRAVRGERDPGAVYAKVLLGSALTEKGDLEAADAILRPAVEMAREILPEQHPPLADALIALGTLLVERGEAGAAEPPLREGLELRRRGLPNSHVRIAHAESALGACLAAQGRYDEAERLLLASLEALHEHGRQGGRATLRRLVRLYESWGRADRAAGHRAALAAIDAEAEAALGESPGKVRSESTSTS